MHTISICIFYLGAPPGISFNQKQENNLINFFFEKLSFLLAD
jgi:hypothetical protein